MWVPAVCFGVFALVVFARLVQVQVIEHERYAARAETELSASQTLFASRGSILDRDGNPLAVSVDTWDIYANSRAWQGERVALETSTVLGGWLDRDPAALREDVRSSEAVDVLLARDVPYETGKAVMDAGLEGVILLPNTDRIYPEGDTGASLLGLTGTDNTGLAGLEAALDDVLRGRPGKLIYERDTAGDPIPFGQHVASDPVAGKDIELTIDRYLQRMAEETLAREVREHEATGGAIIIMNPKTGAILAMATLPALAYSSLDLSDDGQMALLRNRAVTDLYEPGSVMKVVTAAAAIDAGVVSPHTTYVDTGVAEVAGVPIRNWDYNVYGEQTMTGVLQHSINTGAIFMAQKLGAERFQDYLDAFGFGKRTGIELMGEAEGIFRRPTDPGWSPVDLATQSFGQAISVTPLQMATAVAAAINGGQLVQPHLVKAYVSESGERDVVEPRVVARAISEETSATMRDMMQSVLEPGWPHPGQPDEYTAGGKSGTANIPIVNGYNDRQVASFIGFAPADDPEVLVLVKLDDNQDLLTGTQAAGPIFADLVDTTLRHLNVRPDRGRFVGSP